MRTSQLRIATLSLHSSPLAELGGEIAGGMNVFVREVSRELGRFGHRLDIFTRRDNPDQPPVIEIDEGVRLIHLSAGPAASRSRHQISQHIPQLQEALKIWPAEAYDLVHAHYWISGAAGRRWAAEKGIPFVQMFHTMERTKRRVLGDGHAEDPQRSSEEETLGQSADALTVGSLQDRDSLTADYGIAPEKIHVVPGGVNPSVFPPQPQEVARRRTGLPPGRVALFVGRIEPVKGLETLIRALVLLRREGGDNCSWRLVVIGGDADPHFLENNGRNASNHSGKRYLDEVRKLAHDLGMADRVTFLGSKPQKYMADYYAAADCCVFPSIYETFGLAVIEALACGGVVVASEIGGYPHRLAQEKAGLLVPPGNAGAFAEALDRVCTDAVLREDLRRRAPEVARQFTWNNTARQLLEIYRTLIEKNQGRGESHQAADAKEGIAICG